jgi:Helicase conserved C-terminal domain
MKETSPWIEGNIAVNRKKKKRVKIVHLGKKTANVSYVNNANQETYGNETYRIPYSNLETIGERFQEAVQNATNGLAIQKATITVMPNKWTPIQSKYFPEWIQQTFQTYTLDAKHAEEKKTIKKYPFRPFKHQEFLRDYLQHQSPYRGILLYHGLGSGKTCTSITIAEGLRKHNMSIVIMLPASLRGDFLMDGLMYCGDPQYQEHPEMIDSFYTFVSYNASNKLEKLRSLGSLDDRVIIIEEAHNFISQVANGSYMAREMYEMLMKTQRSKIICLSGTPMINEPFEVALMMNLLRGQMEVHRFQLGRIGPEFSSMQYTWEQDCLQSSLANTMHIDITHKMVEVQISIPTYLPEFGEWKRSFIQHAMDTFKIPLQYLDVHTYRLFPDDKDGETFYEEFVEVKEDGTEQLKHESIFKRRLQGLISYYAPKSTNYPKVTHHPLIEVPMSDYQTDVYDIIRAIERAAEKASARNYRSKKAAQRSSSQKSYFRIFSRQCGNFVFPESIPRPFKRAKLQNEISRAIMMKRHPNKFKNLSNEEKKISLTMEDLKNGEDENAELSSTYVQRVTDALAELQTHPEFLREGPNGLSVYSPKMLEVLRNIQKSPGLAFVYSQFKTLEGLQCFGEVLKANGYECFNDQIRSIPVKDLMDFQFPKKKRYALYTGDEDYETRRILKHIYRDPRNKYGDYLQVFMVTSAGAEGLDLKCIRQVHILEPYWNTVRTKQVIGRAVRLGSHVELPEKERTVEIFEYLSVISEKQKAYSQDGGMSSDQYIYSISKKKEEITQRILTILKEVAVDCNLFAYDHGYEFMCQSYPTSVGYAYLPSIYTDFVYQKTEPIVEKKKIERTILLGGIDQERQVWLVDTKTKRYYLAHHFETRLKGVKPEKVNLVQKVGVDLSTMTVYDWSCVKKGGVCQPIGTVNSDNFCSMHN